MAASNLDRKSWTRSYATTAYYLPNKDRKNLVVRQFCTIHIIRRPNTPEKIFTGATASRVMFQDSDCGKDIVATGVEYICNDEKHILIAEKEVVICCGYVECLSIFSPTSRG